MLLEGEGREGGDEDGGGEGEEDGGVAQDEHVAVCSRHYGDVQR